MKVKNTYSLMLCIAIAMLMITGCESGCDGTNVAATSSSTIVFGKPRTATTGGAVTMTVNLDTISATRVALSADSTSTAPCSGRGICNLKVADGTLTTIQLVQAGAMKLIFKFNLADLERNQPDQVKLFKDPSRKYQFEGEFPLTDQEVFGPLHLPANSRILPTDETQVDIINDATVSLKVTFSHD